MTIKDFVKIYQESLEKAKREMMSDGEITAD
jgi:hypothetical protein